MGLFSRTIATAGKWLLRASGTLRDPALISLLGGTPNESGVSVNPQNALGFTPFWCAINQIATGCAKLPLILYRTDGQGKTRATWDPLYTLLHDQPCPEIPSIRWRETLFSRALVHGNGWAEIERDGSGRPVALWNLKNEYCRLTRQPDGTLWLLYDPPEHGPAKIPYRDVFNLCGLGDGLIGLSPVALHKIALGLGMATERYGAKFFGSGARPSGFIKHPKVLSPEASKRLLNDFESIHSGLKGAHRVAILEEGAEFVPFNMPPEEAQFIQTRKFSVVEVARIFNIPPHKLKDLENANNNSLEKENTNFYAETLMPWLERLEQEAALKLLRPQTRSLYTIEHLFDGLLRADQATRYASYAIGRNWGFLSVNEIRAMENLSPIPGGDTYLQPLNMQPLASQLGAQSLPGSPSHTLAGVGHLPLLPFVQNQGDAKP